MLSTVAFTLMQGSARLQGTSSYPWSPTPVKQTKALGRKLCTSHLSSLFDCTQTPGAAAREVTIGNCAATMISAIPHEVGYIVLGDYAGHPVALQLRAMNIIRDHPGARGHDPDAEPDGFCDRWACSGNQSRRRAATAGGGLSAVGTKTLAQAAESAAIFSLEQGAGFTDALQKRLESRGAWGRPSRVGDAMSAPRLSSVHVICRRIPRER